jgi:hypothetical protein
MSKIFTGTLSLADAEYPVRSVLSVSGARLTGTLYFTEDESRVVPISAKVVGTKVSTARNLFFITPDDLTVKLFPIADTDGSLDQDFTSLSLEGTAEIDGGEVAFALACNSVESRISVESVDDAVIEEPLSRTREPLECIRINEQGNVFDHFGGIVGLSRLPRENNVAYLERIERAKANLRGSSYDGLMNAIPLELGLQEFDSIEVSVRDDHSDPIGEIELIIDEGTIKLYSRWVSEEDQRLGLRPVVEQEAVLGVHPIETIGHLVDWINESSNFQARLIDKEETSTLFLRHIALRTVAKEELPPQEILSLANTNVLQGSVSIGKNSSLTREVAWNTELQELSEYCVNYETGTIKCLRPPLGRIPISYLYTKSKVILKVSEVKIMDLSSRATQRQLFHQVTKTFYSTIEEKTKNGLPKEDMYRIIREVLTAGDFDQYWGE